MPKKQNFIFNKISIDDFDKKFDLLDTNDEKFEFSCYYLFSHGLDNRKESCGFMELVHHAKTKFADGVLSKAIDNNILDDNKEKDEVYGKFISDPLQFMEEYADEVAEGVNPKNNKDRLDKFRIHCIRIGTNLKAIREDFKKYEFGAISLDVMKRMCNDLYPNKNMSLSEFLRSTRGGFMENFLHTASKEYMQFKKALYSFSNKRSRYYGDLKYLQSAARNYLNHKIPTFKKDGNDLPKKEDIKKINGDSKRRVDLAYSSLKSIDIELKLLNIIEEYQEKDLFSKEEGFNPFDSYDPDDPINLNIATFETTIENDVDINSLDDANNDNDIRDDEIIKSDDEIRLEEDIKLDHDINVDHHIDDINDNNQNLDNIHVINLKNDNK